ncbi:MAG: gliding motility-associated C-terminal domain-containing protein [Chitinophagales bacterium]
MKYFLKYCLLLCFGLMLQKAQTQSTIPADLICCQTLVSGDVLLTWGASPEACGPFVQYTIYYSNFLAGPYSFFPSIPGIGTTTFTHIGANGTLTTWYYYIVAEYICPGFTMTTSDTLDNLDPVAPQIDAVTVTGGQSVITWFPSPSPETNSYIIYRDNGGFNPIATVYGRFTNTYTDLTGLPTTKVETYTIAARDSCNNLGPFNTESHHTIYLTAQQINCTDELSLSWNLYDTWPTGVNNYQVWVDVNATGATQVATLVSGTTSYTLTGLNDGDNICVTIHALSGDGTALSVSNEFCTLINIVQPADYVVMRNATVNSSTQIVVEWYPDTNADLEKLSVQRSIDNINYTNLITTGAIFPLPPIDSYTDNSVSTAGQSYYYKIITTDSCDAEATSGVVRTILLKGNDNANFSNSLNWNAFEITNGTVMEYNIYRDDGLGFNLIATTGAATFDHIDDVSLFINLIDHFCYKIEAVYQLTAPENGVNEQLSSFSNVLCLDQGPRIYVPNAIVPDGINNIFKPVIIYGTEAGYSMKIFNRYSAVIFETEDINAGWDGRFNDKIVEMGTYGYIISFTATNGQLITKKGNVTVVR